MERAWICPKSLNLAIIYGKHTFQKNMWRLILVYIDQHTLQLHFLSFDLYEVVKVLLARGLFWLV